VTDLLIKTPARDLSVAGGNPGLVVAGQVGRRAARSGALWGLVFGLFVVVQIRAYVSDYTTQAARDQLARAFGTNVGLNALLGQAHDISTVAGWASWRFLGILTILGSVWGLLNATRLIRGDEESGYYELLLAGQTTRGRAGGQAVAGLGAGLLAMFAVTALGTIVAGRTASVGFSLGQCLYFSVTLVAGAAMFLAIGVVGRHLAPPPRRAPPQARHVFGIAYAVRMAADSVPGLHGLVWLSPLGWIEESRPLTDPRPLALLPVLALLVAITAVTLHLAAGRDLNAAAWPGRDSSRAHLALLGGPAGLAVRLMRPAALGWLSAVAGFSVLLGTVAESSTQDLTSSRGVAQAIGRLGGQGSSIAAYLGLTFLVLALLIALVSAGQITAMRAEEADGHLENLLVRAVSRTSWFAARLGLSCLLLIAAGLLAGAGAWAGAASQHSGVRFWSLVTAGLNVVPPGLFLLGLGALVFGAWPRRTSAVVYGYLAWSFLVEFAGGVVHTSHWLLDTSVFFHMAPAPATTPDWSSAAVITGFGVLGVVLGGVLFRRRDLRNA
jgi:ABC-2 type transport system permease protein